MHAIPSFEQTVISHNYNSLELYLVDIFSNQFVLLMAPNGEETNDKCFI